MNGFAARTKPPPEAGRTVVRAIGATLADRWFELKWIERARDNRTDKRRLPNRQRDHTLAQQQQGASIHMPTNLWQPGVSGNPAGRLRGSRNRLSEAVICALLRDFSKHGEKAIAKVRRTQPAAYLKILALLVPREHKVEHRNLLKEMTDEELEAAIEALQAMMATQAENAKVINGIAEPTTTAAPTEFEQSQRKRSNRLLEHVDTAIGPTGKPR